MTARKDSNLQIRSVNAFPRRLHDPAPRRHRCRQAGFHPADSDHD